VRCREVKGEQIETANLSLVDEVYETGASQEHFLQFVTPATPEIPEGHLAGYLRLSLPLSASPDISSALPDLLHPASARRAALIREVHVYGQSLAVGQEQAGAAQHAGLGTRLLAEAARIARGQGYPRLAVIAAVGTRLYYESRGFQRGALYHIMDL
jgi:elongator complex protein 3